jgi:type I restriction enzyme M protein
MIDASHGYVKDGDKNRLREEDIYRIVNTFNEEITDDPRYAKKIPLSEVLGPKNDGNLNISRYIDSTPKEDNQDLAGHILGGIPEGDISDLKQFWTAFPCLRDKLFSKIRDGYFKLKVDKNKIQETITSDKDFLTYMSKVSLAFDDWKREIYPQLESLNDSVNPKELLGDWALKLITYFEPLSLVNKYDVYQVLLSYWNDSMADDVYVITKDGFESGRGIEEHFKKQKEGEPASKKKRESWDGVIIPKDLVVHSFFRTEELEIQQLQNDIEQLNSEIQAMTDDITEDSPLFDCLSQDSESENDDSEKTVDPDAVLQAIEEIKSRITNQEIVAIKNALAANSFQGLSTLDFEQYLSDNPLLQKAAANGKITKKSLNERLEKLQNSLPVLEEDREDFATLKRFNGLFQESKAKLAKSKVLTKTLDQKAEKSYSVLSVGDIKHLVIDEKWISFLKKGIEDLYQSISETIASRINVLAERYEMTLGEIDEEISSTEDRLAGMLPDLKATGEGSEGKNPPEDLALKELALLLYHGKRDNDGGKK